MIFRPVPSPGPVRNRRSSPVADETGSPDLLRATIRRSLIGRIFVNIAPHLAEDMH